MNILVIGAGVLGLSASHALTQAGHTVDLVEREGVYAGASHRSFAWINANHKLPEAYYRLNAAGIAAHHDFQEEHAEKGTWYHTGGCILADSSAAAAATYEDRFAEAEELGYPVERIDRTRLNALEPAAKWAEGIDQALFFPTEGHLENDLIGRVFVDLLAEAGVEVRLAEVDALTPGPDGVEVTFAGLTPQTYDKVVIAAGAESRVIAERSGLRLPVASLDEPGPRTHSLLGVTAPTDVELHRVIISDTINVRPRHDGRLLVQIPELEERTSEGESEELLNEVKLGMEAALNEFFDTEIEVETVIFSGRSFPEDGLSIVGYLDPNERVYSLVTHSGMTLGPLLGRLTASEIGGATEDLLSEFRPSRFGDEVEQVEQGSFIGRQ